MAYRSFLLFTYSVLNLFIFTLPAIPLLTGHPPAYTTDYPDGMGVFMDNAAKALRKINSCLINTVGLFAVYRHHGSLLGLLGAIVTPSIWLASFLGYLLSLIVQRPVRDLLGSLVKRSSSKSQTVVVARTITFILQFLRFVTALYLLSVAKGTKYANHVYLLSFAMERLLSRVEREWVNLTGMASSEEQTESNLDLMSWTRDPVKYKGPTWKKQREDWEAFIKGTDYGKETVENHTLHSQVDGSDYKGKGH